MIVKFHARGSGRGSGPVEYLLGKDREREGATLDRGDPDQIQALIDSSPYTKKYTSGVLSFEESYLDRQTKDRLMSSFEKALLPGLDKDQYSCLWVEHRDKGRLELNFVVPNVELLSGKRLQPYFDKADKPRINAWKTGMNASLKLHDPDDPINKRELTTPRNLPQSKQEAARAITDGLLSMAGNGELNSRNDVVNALEMAGFTVARQTNKSISIADPDGGRNIRLKGQIYEQNFRFSPELRGEIEAASARYRATSQERIREAREVYRTGVEIKRAENHRRYKRPESTYEHVSSKKLALDSVECVSRPSGLYGRDLVAREDYSDEPTRDQSSENHDRTAGIGGWEDSTQRMRKTFMRPDRRESTDLSGRLQDFERVLNHDGTRTAAIERIRKLTESTRETTQRLCDSFQKFGENVRHYIERERGTKKPSDQLERASKYLEHSASAVGKAIHTEKSIIKQRDKGRGFTL